MLQVRDGLRLVAMTSRPRNRAGRSSRTLVRRRLLVAVLNVVTVAALASEMAYILSYGGWSVLKAAMLLAFLVTLPWLSIGFWNAIIGAFVLNRSEKAATEDPFALVEVPDKPIFARTAIVMAIRNEDPREAIGRLKAICDEIQKAGLSAHFDFHVLSDTNIKSVGLAEELAMANWKSVVENADQVHYRRRTSNHGYKAGNIEEFCQRAGENYDFFLPLDADSFMSAAAITRLVRILQDNPRIGILQSLVVGTPAKSLFTRCFQFGMRHGMRAYTSGSAWWQSDCGPFWGHNALIRMAPFRDYCKLPVLPGHGPLGGQIMSHDQVEAVLMRRAGYHVRVLAEEGESWEENPPTLPDFIRRELRWCQGNMQYLQLLSMPGLHPMSRMQLALAILMYLGAVGWMAFIAIGSISVLTNSHVGDYPAGHAAVLFSVIILMSLMPKLMGLAGIIASREQCQRYGGRGRVVTGGIFEILFSTLVSPIVNFAIAIFAIGLAFGKRLDWRAQERAVRSVSWKEAIVTFLPQTAFGLGIAALFFSYVPSMLPWALPVVTGFVVSIPFAVLTASDAAGQWSRRTGLWDIPEDVAMPPLLARLLRKGEEPPGKPDLRTNDPKLVAAQ